MEQSILKSTKKMVGLDADYDVFDLDILTCINSALSTLNQIGVGIEEGFEVEDDQLEWSHLLGDDPRLNSVKTYVHLKVRLLFDPPATSFVITSMEKQIQELEWRLMVAVDPPYSSRGDLADV